MLKVSELDYKFLSIEFPEVIPKIKENDLRGTLSKLFEKIVYYTVDDGEGDYYITDEGKKFDRIYNDILYDNKYSK